MLIYIFLIAALLQQSQVLSKKGFGPGEQDWGFVKVDEGAHMFYWLYYTQAAVSNYTDRPLLIWLQGGPGVAASYFGNFNFIGPLDTKLNKRYGSWPEYLNVLFVDCPVGIGYSYVDDIFKYPKNNHEITLHLIELMKVFYERQPAFIEVPVLIFGESYGGKIAVEFALEFYKSKDLKNKPLSVSIINPWISPKDILSELPTASYYLGAVDQKEREIMNQKMEKMIKLLDKDMSSWAFIYGGVVLPSYICEYWQGTSVFNVDYKIKKDNMDNCGLDFLDPTAANDLMNNAVMKALNITVTKWKATFVIGIASLAHNIPKTVLPIVNQLLNSTDVHVNVISGSHDLLVSTAGTLKWIDKLDYPTKNEYEEAPRKGFFINNILEGYEKVGKDLSMFWIQRSGHEVAKDNFKALSYVLRKVAGIEDKLKEN